MTGRLSRGVLVVFLVVNMPKSETIEQFTEQAVLQLPFQAAGQRIVFERALSGFGVVIGTTSKSYFVQAKIKRGDLWVTRRITVGRTDSLTLKVARRLAVIAADELEKEPPVVERVPLITFSNAWANYKTALVKKGRSPRTIASYKSHFDLYLSQWRDRALQSLADNPSDVQSLHLRLSLERGPYCANGVIRTISAIYNHAARVERRLKGLNPAEVVDKNREYRRQTAMAPDDHSKWWSELQAFDNPSRLGFHLISLLTGSRPDALKRARWDHLDLNKRCWHFPSPKGGSDRKFDIPICDELLEVLRQHQAECQCMDIEDWIFPSIETGNHISETKEDRNKLSKWGNDLRQTFRTMGFMAEVDHISMHLLMNHKIAGVNAGYLNLVHIWPSLIEKQGQIIRLILMKLHSQA